MITIKECSKPLSAVFSVFSTILKRVFLVTVVVPATVAGLFLAASFGWSFQDAAYAVYDHQSQLQRLGAPSAPGTIVVEQCHISPSANDRSPPIGCERHSVEEVTVQSLAASTGKLLLTAYLMLVAITSYLYAGFYPPSRLRLRKSVANKCNELLHSLFNRSRQSVADS